MNFRSIIWLLPLTLLIGLGTGCKSRTANIGGEEVARVQEPFSQKKYRSDNKHFRAVGSAESNNLNFAKEQALFTAKRELASNVNTTMRSVAQRYAGERNVGDKMAFSQGFEDLTREVLDTRLAAVKVIGEEVFRRDNNRYIAYVAVEIDMTAFYYSLTERIGSKREIREFWNEEHFRKIYEEEMNRFQ